MAVDKATYGYLEALTMAKTLQLRHDPLDSESQSLKHTVQDASMTGAM